jgi:hypothetical protein
VPGSSSRYWRLALRTRSNPCSAILRLQLIDFMPAFHPGAAIEGVHQQKREQSGEGVVPKAGKKLN